VPGFSLALIDAAADMAAVATHAFGRTLNLSKVVMGAKRPDFRERNEGATQDSRRLMIPPEIKPRCSREREVVCATPSLHTRISLNRRF
jgi:hypothetical protein